MQIYNTITMCKKTKRKHFGASKFMVPALGVFKVQDLQFFFADPH